MEEEPIDVVTLNQSDIADAIAYYLKHNDKLDVRLIKIKNGSKGLWVVPEYLYAEVEYVSKQRRN